MDIQENVELAQYSTMRLGGRAQYLCVVHSRDELEQALSFAKDKNVRARIIGEGSNIIFSSKGYDGLIIVNHIFGVAVIEETDDSVEIEFGAGIRWDDAVAYSVVKDLSGIEAMSLIPGLVGAGPVQNIGAYGQQLSDTLASVEAYDFESGTFTTLSKDTLELGYRTSILKNIDRQRYFISSVRLKLHKSPTITTLYSDVEQYFKEHGVDEVTPHSVREAVIAIRERKLPDPRAVANTGSFFANPVVSRQQFDIIAEKHPEINQPPDGWPQPPRWIQEDGTVKISAGWLVTQAGFKDYEDEETGMATWPNQALVLINKHAKSSDDLMKFRDKIVNAVKEKYGITLQQEPETII